MHPALSLLVPLDISAGQPAVDVDDYLVNVYMPVFFFALTDLLL